MTTEDPWSSFTSNLVLLAVGADITCILVPYFTRGWQNRKGALKFKEKFVTHIATSVTSILRATQWTEHNLIDITMKTSIEEQANEKQQGSVIHQASTDETHETEKKRITTSIPIM